MKTAKIIIGLILIVFLAACSNFSNTHTPQSDTETESLVINSSPAEEQEGSDSNHIIVSDTINEYHNSTLEKTNLDQTVFFDCSSLKDNDTSIKVLLERQSPLSKEITIGLLSTFYSTDYVDTGNGITNTNLTAIKSRTGQDISFFRTGAEFYNSVYDEYGIRCYTVFETEMGGYIYIYFDWYPDLQENNTKIRIVSYAPRVLCYKDIPKLDRWKDCPQKLSEVIKEDEYLTLLSKENAENGIFGYAIHTLKDGFLFAGTASGTDCFLDGYILQNSFVWDKATATGNEADNIDFTILPQDYPPAE